MPSLKRFPQSSPQGRTPSTHDQFCFSSLASFILRLLSTNQKVASVFMRSNVIYFCVWCVVFKWHFSVFSALRSPISIQLKHKSIINNAWKLQYASIVPRSFFFALIPVNAPGQLTLLDSLQIMFQVFGTLTIRIVVSH